MAINEHVLPNLSVSTDEAVPDAISATQAGTGLASYNCAQLCDVEFKFPNSTSLYSHSHILKEACGYFDTLLSFHAKAHVSEEEKIVVQVKDITSDELVFRRFILYLHTGSKSDLALTSDTIATYLHLQFYLDVKAPFDLIAHACGKVKRTIGWLNDVKVSFDAADTAIAEEAMTNCIRQVVEQPCLLSPSAPNNDCHHCLSYYNNNNAGYYHHNSPSRCTTCFRCQDHCDFKRIFPAATLTGVWLISAVQKGMPVDIFKIRKAAEIQPRLYKALLAEIRETVFEDISAKKKEELVQAMHVLFSVA